MRFPVFLRRFDVSAINLLRGLVLMLAVAFALTASPALAQTAPQTAGIDRDRCEALAGGQFQNLQGAPTWITRASYVAQTPQRQAFCSVLGYVNPVSNFALYLPMGEWNGRYVVRGCGGSCGTIAMELVCGRHVRGGNACLVTDMGHSSSIVDNVWVADNLPGLVDFGYRSTHTTTVAGRAIATRFYGAAPRKAYFYGCSTGGRQALIAAQRFPEDFDGIVAVAPASVAPFGLRQAPSIAELDAANAGPEGRAILPNRKAVLIHAAVVRACDGDDGVKDGLISDPRRCRWEPEQIACKTAAARDCLTAAQIAVAHRFYRERGLQKGSELNWIGAYIRNAPLPGQAWQPAFDLGVGRGDPALIQTLTNANNPDLRPFRNNGGKLILAHGWADHSTLPPPTIDYFETMTKTMGGAAATAQFARLFLIPGMDHCAGGEGAGSIDYLAEMVAWVEGGTAPTVLRGVHPTPGAPVDYYGVDLAELDPKYIEFQRDHHVFPGPSVPFGKDRVIAPDARPLDARLSDAITVAENAAAAASFPRNSTLNAIAKGMWQLFYRADASADAQAAALAKAAAAPLSPIAREAVLRMQAELALD